MTRFQSELSGDFVSPMYRTSMGGMATVDLTGIKSSVHHVPKKSAGDGVFPGGYVTEQRLRYL
jgi:hypothetical protein